MFEKIDFKLPEVNFEKLKGPLVIKYGQNPVIAYYNIPDKSLYDKLMSVRVFLKTPPNHVQVAEIVGQGHLGPHIDHNINACANYYLDTNCSTTYFYNRKPDQEGTIYPGMDKPNIFKFDQVTLVSAFTAQPKDFYLLDVSSIHSVLSPGWKVRRFITWQWAVDSYLTVKNSLS